MAKKILLFNIDELVTMKGARKKSGRRPQIRDLSIIKNGYVVIENGKISQIGKNQDFKLDSPETFYKKYDLQGCCVLPGLIDCHTHSIFAGDRQDEFELRNKGVSYQEIAKNGGGILSTVKNTRTTSAAGLLKLVEPRMKSYLRQGVSTVEIKSGYGLSHSSEIKILKVAGKIKDINIVRTFLGAHSIPKEAKSIDHYFSEIINKTLPVVAKKKLADRVDIFIEKGYFTPQQAEQLFERSKSFGLDSVAHTEQLSYTGGYKHILHCCPKSLDHMVMVKNKDLPQLARTNVSVTLLPSADFYLQIPYPPARKMIDEGVRVAIATDFNPGSSPTQSLNFTGILARLKMKMSLAEVITGFTVSAAFALGREKEIGSIEVGKWADLCVVSGSYKNLFYSVGEHPVLQTWVRGVKKF